LGVDPTSGFDLISQARGPLHLSTRDRVEVTLADVSKPADLSKRMVVIIIGV
jgi:hypothetical protein